MPVVSFAVERKQSRRFRANMSDESSGAEPLRFVSMCQQCGTVHRNAAVWR